MPGWYGAVPHIRTTALYRRRTLRTFPAVPSSTSRWEPSSFSSHRSFRFCHNSFQANINLFTYIFSFSRDSFSPNTFYRYSFPFPFLCLFIQIFCFFLFLFFFWRQKRKKRWDSCWCLTSGPPLLTSWEPRVQVWASMPAYWYCLKIQALSTTPVHIQISKVVTGIQKILGPPSPPTQLTSNRLSFSVDQNTINLLFINCWSLAYIILSPCIFWRIFQNNTGKGESPLGSESGKLLVLTMEIAKR